MASGCGRFVHPAVTDPDQRKLLGRFVGLMLAAPFFAAPGLTIALFDKVEPTDLAAIICVVSGLSWLAPILTAFRFPQRTLQLAVLAAGSAVTGAVIAGAGGLPSPLSLMALALLFEPCWLRRSRPAALCGAAAVAAAIAMAEAAGLAFPVRQAISGWHWLAPIAYLVTIWMRRDALSAPPAPNRLSLTALREMAAENVVARLGRNGEVVDIGAQSARLFLLPPPLLLGNALFERIHIADRVCYLSALADLRNGAERRRVNVRLRLPRGDRQDADVYRSFAANLAALPEEDEFVVLFSDETEIAELRARLDAALDAADSIEIAKSRFLAAVSHELRTPLNAILGFSDMLLHEMFGRFADRRQKEYVGLIRDAGQHLLSVVNAILDISKIESGTYAIHPEPFSFGHAVEACRSMIRPQAAAKSISVVEKIALREQGPICADRRAVQQMLLNLLSNAVKFTPDGGEIVIGAERVDAGLRFWIADTGIGICEADLKRLGRPFIQVQNDYTRQFEGTGLGLSLVKGLVTLHEGTMEIESAPGKGTTVTITLPLAGPSTREAAKVRAPAMAVEDGRGDEAQRKTA